MTTRDLESWAEVGERVTLAREGAGMTQSALAARVGLERTALAKVEAGTRSLSSLELARLARALDLPLAWFVTESCHEVIDHRAAPGDATGSTVHAILERHADDYWSHRTLEDLAREQGVGGSADLDALFAEDASPEEADAFMSALAELD